MVRQHQHHPRPTCHFLGCRPLAGYLFQLGVLRRRGVDTVPLNEHAPPYQGGPRTVQHFVYSYFVLRTLGGTLRGS